MGGTKDTIQLTWLLWLVLITCGVWVAPSSAVWEVFLAALRIQRLTDEMGISHSLYFLNYFRCSESFGIPPRCSCFSLNRAMVLLGLFEKWLMCPFNIKESGGLIKFAEWNILNWWSRYRGGEQHFNLRQEVDLWADHWHSCNKEDFYLTNLDLLLTGCPSSRQFHSSRFFSK